MKACPTVKRECAGRPAPGPGACIINTNPHSRPPLRMLELTTLTLTLPAQGPGAGIINVYPHTSGPNSGHYQRLPSHLRAQRRALSTLTLNLREKGGSLRRGSLFLGEWRPLCAEVSLFLGERRSLCAESPSILPKSVYHTVHHPYTPVHTPYTPVPGRDTYLQTMVGRHIPLLGG